MGSRFVETWEARGHTGMRALVVGAAFLFTFIVASPSAFADTHVSATLSSDHLQPNTSITASGAGFKPNTPVDFYVDSAYVQTVNSNGSGTASVPITGSMAFVGTHRVRIVGIDAGNAARIATAVFTEVACSPPPSGSTLPPACQAHSLPRTGVDYRGWAIAGALSILIGATLVRRRRRDGASIVPPNAVALIGAAAVVGGLVAGVGPARAQTTSSGPTTTAAPGSISGTVTADAGGGPLTAVCVHARSNDRFGSALTGANGTYTIANLPPGNYQLAFADCNPTPTYFSENWNNKSGFSNDSVSVAPGQQVTGINAGLARGALVSGRVTDASDGSGIGGVCVLGGIAADNLQACTAMSGASGAFGTDVVAAGNFIIGYLEFSGTHAIQYLGNKPDPASSTRLALAPGDAKNASIALPVGATVTGRVTDASTGKNTVHDICVYDRSSDVRTLASGFVFASGTDAGELSLKQLAPGTHKIEFTDCGFQSGAQYIPEFFDNKADVAHADPLALSAAQTRSGVDAALLREGDTEMTTTTTSPTPTSSTTTSSTVVTTQPSTAAGQTNGTGSTASTDQAGISSSTAQQGGELSVSGDGFAPGSPVIVYIYSTPLELARGSADTNGRFSATVTIPGSIEPGVHTIQLQGTDPGGRPRVLSVSVTVVARTGVLSRTGADVAGAIELGGGILLLGFALLRLSDYGRRRYPRGLYFEL